jgi:hypothetical protein
MATVITVHGTGVDGPEEGEAWWQKDSPFENHIRELVESTDGELNFRTLSWNGNNSEKSRRNAARKLYKTVRQLEAKNEKYCLIGHSHGGSVIANALLLAASKSNRLPNLVKCITIATPFIQSKKSFWLFSRSGLIGKSLLVSGTSFGFIMRVYYFYYVNYPWSVYRFIQDTVYLLGPFFAIYCLLLLINHRMFFMYRPKILRFSRNEYGDRLVSLRHNNDEAVNGLKSLKNLDIRLFQRGFAVSTFSFASIFFVPLLLIAMATIPPFPFPFLDHALGVTGNFLERIGAVSYNIVELITTLIHKLYPHFIQRSYVRPPKTIRLYFFYVISPMCVVIVLSLVITFSIKVISGYISSVMSIVMNRSILTQIRKIGFGNDTIGEVSIDADGSCPWLGSPWSPIPEQLSDEITNLSDRAASVAVVKLRGLVRQLAISRDRVTSAFFFSEYLTWDELIHTSYFSVPRFRMLVAYSIANSVGFHPSAAFKSHPDHELVARWYVEIQPKKGSRMRVARLTDP